MPKNNVIPLLTSEIEDFLSQHNTPGDSAFGMMPSIPTIKDLLDTGDYTLSVQRFKDGRIKGVGVTAKDDHPEIKKIRKERKQQLKNLPRR